MTNHAPPAAIVRQTKSFGVDQYEPFKSRLHDSVPFVSLVPKKPAFHDQEVYADSAYVGEEIDATLKKRDYKRMICEKGFRNRPLTED